MKSFYDSTKIINFKKQEFKVAFAVESYDDFRSGKDDPNYVRWVVQLTSIIGNVEKVLPLRFHKCTDADYDSFFQPAASFELQMRLARQRKNMFCIDEEQEIEVYGMNDQTVPLQRLDFMLLPCIKNGSVCNSTLAEKIEYLGSPDLVIMSNSIRFDSTDYTDNKLVKETIFQNKQFFGDSPAFINSLISLNSLQD
jgi:hypothetical protein